MSKFTGQASMIVDKYILYFNQRNFASLAQLFSHSGVLAPPFEEQIVGRRAIYQYLLSTVEATFEPIAIKSKGFDNTRTQIDVYGSLRADTFRVDTDWTFLLNANAEIALVQVKLRLPLAKLKNLCLHQQSFFTLQQYSPYFTEKYLKVTVNYLHLQPAYVQVH